MNGTRMLGRVMRHSAIVGTVLAFPLFALLALIGSSTVIAENGPLAVQACQQQFQTERAMCNSLTGQARAACQRQAAERFRTCRGQASPTTPGGGPSGGDGDGGGGAGGGGPLGTPNPAAANVSSIGTREPNFRSSPKWLLRLQRTTP